MSSWWWACFVRLELVACVEFRERQALVAARDALLRILYVMSRRSAGSENYGGHEASLEIILAHIGEFVHLSYWRQVFAKVGP